MMSMENIPWKAVLHWNLFRGEGDSGSKCSNQQPIMSNRKAWISPSFRRATVFLAWTCSVVLLSDNVSAEDDCSVPATYSSESCPDICDCYEGKTYCDNKGLDEVPENLTISFNYLDLSLNNLTRISVGDFDSYPCLEYLSLKLNNISDIKLDALKPLERLKTLILYQNHLTKVSWMFPPSLEVLDMQQNKLKELPDCCFEGLANLNFLHLTRNEIHSIAPCAFCDLVNLRELYLDANRIENLTEGVFSSLTELRVLALSENNFKTIDSLFFDGLTRLETLRFSSNKIENLTGALANLTKLETLELSWNNLKKIESRFFDGLTNLKTLHLGWNQIENLTGDPSNGNLNGAFSNLTMLETLSFPENNLTLIDSRFFFGLSNLKTLSFAYIPTFVMLDESAFDSLKNLTVLFAYNSPFLVQSIVKSTRMLRSLSNIQELYISENQIVSLREDFPSFFPRLRRISLWGNLWHCDENIKWLLNWLKNSGDIFIQKWDMQCATPASIALKPILMLNEKDFQTLTTAPSTPTGYSDHDSSTPSLKTEPANADSSVDDLQAERSPSRVSTSPRLPIRKEEKESHSPSTLIPIVLANGCFVLAAVALLIFALFRLRHKCTLVKHCPQNDIVTVLSPSERTIKSQHENS